MAAETHLCRGASGGQSRVLLLLSARTPPVPTLEERECYIRGSGRPVGTYSLKKIDMPTSLGCTAETVSGSKAARVELGQE